MKTFTHDDLLVAYHDDGAGPAVVMLHNGGTSSTIWRNQVDALVDRHRVIAVDLPGFGSSPRPDRPSTLAAIVDLLDALIAELELAPALLVGNCMGANISACLARQDPGGVRGILAVNPLTEATFSAGGLGGLHRMQGVAAAPTRVLRSLSRRVPTPHPVAPLSLRFQLGAKGVERRLHHDPDLLACQIRPDQMPALVDVLDDMAAYGRLDTEGVPEGTPVWIVWGAQNRVLSRRNGAHLAEVLHAERVAVLDGCGHLPMLEDPEVVTDLLHELIEHTTASSAEARQEPETRS